jgi:hypothetical protein
MDFDFNYLPDRLFVINVLIFENSDPDIRVVEVPDDVDLALFAASEIGPGMVQTIVSNSDPETKDRCPYFRLVASPPSDGLPINFKLQTFLNKIGQGHIMTPRCTKVIVVGLHALNNLESPISIPLAFCTTTIDPMDYGIDTVVDIACLQPVGGLKSDSSEALCQIAGLCLPVHVPDACQWRILSYLEEPTAAMIKDQIDKICVDYDAALLPMFQQREPRLPPIIASFYNASTVQTAIRGATRSFLVPRA